MNQEAKFMQLALKLARRGGRAVAPNPMVGAVIVKKGRIIGRGWHQKFGKPHAEVNAIRSVRRKSDLRGATLYATLEPCRHWGKTPPCAELIAAVGISHVIYGSRDPFQRKSQITNKFQIPNPKSQTNSKSQIPNHKQILNSKSLQRECQELTKFFFTWVTKKRPYITVKIAMSADGFVAAEGGRPVRITNRKQDRFVHKLRAEHQAIMVGINTVLCDDPHLGVRLVKGQDPLRIILDSHHRTPPNAKVRRDKNYRIVTAKRGRVNLKKLMSDLAKEGIASALVEPGPTLYQSLQKAGFIDELIVLISKKKLKRGLRFSF